MAFVISTQTLSAGWEMAQSTARNAKSAAQQQKDESLVGTMRGSRVLQFERELVSYRQRLDTIAAYPGIGDYVSGLPDTPVGYDVANEWAALRIQIVATTDWIRTNFPKDSTNTYILERSWGADGPVERTFTSAQLASYRTQLDALIGAIE